MHLICYACVLQGRPDGAELEDHGMPSSHAMVSDMILPCELLD